MTPDGFNLNEPSAIAPVTADKPVCEHVNREVVGAFIYDQVRCSDCWAWLGEALENHPLI